MHKHIYAMSIKSINNKWIIIWYYDHHVASIPVRNYSVIETSKLSRMAPQRMNGLVIQNVNNSPKVKRKIDGFWNNFGLNSVYPFLCKTSHHPKCNLLVMSFLLWTYQNRNRNQTKKYQTQVLYASLTFTS